MNKRIKALADQSYDSEHGFINPEKFAELMLVEFCDVVKSTANELAEHYIREGCSEEEVLMRVNGALAVLGHIRARFKD